MTSATTIDTSIHPCWKAHPSSCILKQKVSQKCPEAIPRLPQIHLDQGGRRQRQQEKWGRGTEESTLHSLWPGPQLKGGRGTESSYCLSSSYRGTLGCGPLGHPRGSPWPEFLCCSHSHSPVRRGFEEKETRKP